VVVVEDFDYGNSCEFDREFKYTWKSLSVSLPILSLYVLELTLSSSISTVEIGKQFFNRFNSSHVLIKWAIALDFDSSDFKC